MQTVHASIDDKTRKTLDKVAEQQSRTRSSLIAAILRSFAEKQATKKS